MVQDSADGFQFDYAEISFQFQAVDFPPTQRFGLVVLTGCVIDILANLFVLPLLGGGTWKKRD